MANIERLPTLQLGDLREMILRSPAVLFDLSVNINIEAKIAHLQKKLKIDDEELRSLVKRWPIVFSMSMFENLEPKMEYLEKRFALSSDEVRSFLLKNPPFIDLDTTNKLDPMIAFVANLLGGPREALTFLEPHYLKLDFSLKNRLIPRRDRMVKVGIEFNALNLSYMFRKSNDDFNVWCVPPTGVDKSRSPDDAL
jgi:hypothetical protein